MLFTYTQSAQILAKDPRYLYFENLQLATLETYKMTTVCTPCYKLHLLTDRLVA